MTKMQKVTARSQFSQQCENWHKQNYAEVFMTLDYSASHAKVAEHALKYEYFKYLLKNYSLATVFI